MTLAHRFLRDRRQLRPAHTPPWWEHLALPRETVIGLTAQAAQRGARLEPYASAILIHAAAHGWRRETPTARRPCEERVVIPFSVRGGPLSVA